MPPEVPLPLRAGQCPAIAIVLDNRRRSRNGARCRRRGKSVAPERSGRLRH
ncbi:hypothetical protein OCGS_0399 [Oceaniovalibus guishaninsula JLT2003]|uniref:Uncharacterized protein n=1 Tax=Oceaniovalibus guishaninsula JLT2003 TaxID=1231392 RepID=K2HRC1_9RHOB|nr:hypothetical protein OCGS_0399 [Oceaniovalibus guishaninsula JLT2003]